MEVKTVRIIYFLLIPSSSLILLGTVLLHLFAGALGKRRSASDCTAPIPGLYIAVPSPFPILEKFIQDAAKDYNLDLLYCRPPQEDTIETVVTPAAGDISQGSDYIHPLPRPRGVGKAKGGEGMRQALEMYKVQFPDINGILIGTRRTDPHGGMYFPNSYGDAY